MARDDRSSYTIRPETLFTLPGALLISVVILACGVGVGWANLNAKADEITMVKAKVELLEQDSRKIDVMANDVQWIKQELVRQNREQSRRPAATP